MSDRRPWPGPRNVSSRETPSLSVTNRDWTRCIAAGQDGKRPQLAVGKSPGLGRDLEGHGPDPRRSGQREYDGATAPRFDRERPGGHARRQAERRGQVFVRDRVHDFERHGSRKACFAGVVDHHPELGRIALAEEARKVGADHEILDRARFLLQAAPHEVLGHAMDEHTPAGDRIGHCEFHRSRAVRAGQEVGLPEGRFGKIGAQRHGRVLGGAVFFGNRIELRYALLIVSCLQASFHLDACRDWCHFRHDPTNDSSTSPVARPPDPVSAEDQEIVRPERRVGGKERPSGFFRNSRGGQSERGIPCCRRAAVGIEAQKDSAAYAGQKGPGCDHTYRRGVPMRPGRRASPTVF